jgi:hypothetical protein
MNVDDRFPDPVDITEQVEILRSGPSFRGPYSYLLRGLYLGDKVRFTSCPQPAILTVLIGSDQSAEYD